MLIFFICRENSFRRAEVHLQRDLPQASLLVKILFWAPILACEKLTFILLSGCWLAHSCWNMLVEFWDVGLPLPLLARAPVILLRDILYAASVDYGSFLLFELMTCFSFLWNSNWFFPEKCHRPSPYGNISSNNSDPHR